MMFSLESVNLEREKIQGIGEKREKWKVQPAFVR